MTSVCGHARNDYHSFGNVLSLTTNNASVCRIYPDLRSWRMTAKYAHDYFRVYMAGSLGKVGIVRITQENNNSNYEKHFLLNRVAIVRTGFFSETKCFLGK